MKVIRYFLAIALLSLGAVTAGQAQSREAAPSLENWDVGAVAVIPENKPAPPPAKEPVTPTKTKAPDGKTVPAKNEAPEAGKKSTPEVTKPIAPAPAAKGAIGPAEVRQFSTGRQELDQIILKASQENGVDPYLIFSVMRQESGFKPQAVSHKGARGLMQLIPATARRFGVNNIFDPKENVQGGTRYLKFLLDKFNGDVELALAGYNAGEGAVIRYGYQIPPYSETRNYVRSIMSRYGRTEARRLPNKLEEQAAITPAVVLVAGPGALTLSNNY